MIQYKLTIPYHTKEQYSFLKGSSSRASIRLCLGLFRSAIELWVLPWSIAECDFQHRSGIVIVVAVEQRPKRGGCGNSSSCATTAAALAPPVAYCHTTKTTAALLLLGK